MLMQKYTHTHTHTHAQKHNHNHNHTHKAVCTRRADGGSAGTWGTGTQFSCFTGTKVHILTQVACFNCAKVHILTKKRVAVASGCSRVHCVERQVLYLLALLVQKYKYWPCAPLLYVFMYVWLCVYVACLCVCVCVCVHISICAEGLWGMMWGWRLGVGSSNMLLLPLTSLTRVRTTGRSPTICPLDGTFTPTHTHTHRERIHI